MKHKHAELMLKYAQDAMETDKPWERWDWKPTEAKLWKYATLTTNPTWSEQEDYRRKPQKVKMWQWIIRYKLAGEEIITLTDFYPNEGGVRNHLDESVLTKIIGKAEWTEIEVSAEYVSD